jgi:hypothetical protein
VTNRRELLQVGLVATALPLGAAALGTSPRIPGVRTVDLYKVVYDMRFAASVAFARRAAVHGYDVAATEGDITRVWYDDLYHRWQRGPAAIAGLMGRGALFCLEQLAADQRMRVVFRAEHAVAQSGAVHHALEGPAALVETTAAAVGAGDWVAAMAECVAACPSDRQPRGSARVSSEASSAPAPVGEPLFSFVIAPLARA